MRTETNEPWPCGFCGVIAVGEAVVRHARQRHHPDAYPRWELDDRAVKDAVDESDVAAMRHFGWDPKKATAAEWRRLIMLAKPRATDLRWAM